MGSCSCSCCSTGVT